MSAEALPFTRVDRGMVVIREADSWVDRLVSAIADAHAPLGDSALLVREIERIGNRLAAAKLRAIAAADAEKAPQRTGLPNTGMWVARHSAIDGRKAATQAGLAEGLGNQPIPDRSASAADETIDCLIAIDPETPQRSRTGVAFDAGQISTEHAVIIANTMADLPGNLDDELRDQCEIQLIKLAVNRAPAKLRPLARRVLESVLPTAPSEVVDEHENQQLVDEEQRAREAASFWIKDNQDGTCTGHFIVPTLAGHTLRKVLDAMTAPRRRRASDAGALAGAAGRFSVDSRKRAEQWRRRRGQAFAEVLEHLPTDGLHDKIAAAVIVTTRLDDLQEKLTRAGQTDTGHRLSAGEVRRIACGAALLPTVMDGESVPVDVGRMRRCFTHHQRAALATMYTECATFGCDRPFAWSELHHEKPWAAGGLTDLANALPLCSYHHHLLHDGRDHRVHRDRGGIATVTFHRRT